METSPTRNQKASEIRGCFAMRAAKPLTCLLSDTFSVH